MNIFCLSGSAYSVTHRLSMAVGPNGQVPAFEAGPIMKIKRENRQLNVAVVLLQEVYELCRLHVGMASIVMDGAESNFTKSSHDT